MKLLIDTCVWRGVKKVLIKAGHDVIWAGDWEQDPGDEAILGIAYQENRILVTLDRDFGQLAVRKFLHHCGILRLVNLSTRQQSEVCLRVLELYSSELSSGSIITAELGRVRIRSAD